MAGTTHKLKLSAIISALESWAPRELQESYDNSGLLVGDPNSYVSGAVVTLDCTEEVVMEAKRKGAGLIITHHPVIFSGLKKLTGANYVERTVMAAVRNDIAIYAIHTNLDNVSDGVNRMICDKLGILNASILQPKQGNILKISTYVPEKQKEKVLDAMFRAGAGEIGNYSECSFSVSGLGTFRAGDGTKPFVGKKGVRHREPEAKVEVIIEDHKQHPVLAALISSHPYEEVAYDLYRLENQNNSIGAGMIGNLKNPVSWNTFLKRLKSSMKTGCIRHTDPVGDKVRRIAVCGGSGSFLLPQAISAGADVLVTADFKYHQFFDADGRIMIADIGHYESEQFTGELIISYLRQKFPKFALRLTAKNTNPVRYF